MKYIIVLCIGACVGVGGTMDHYDLGFRKGANAHLDAAVSSASTAAHNAIQSAQK